MKLSKEVIYEIASELENEMDCYLHKDSGETIFMPSLDDPYFEEEHWANDLDIIRKNKNFYHKLKQMNSEDELLIMQNFAKSVKDIKIQEELFRILEMRAPSKRFKSEIICQSTIREEWYKFKEQAYQIWVEKNIEEL